MTNMLSAFLPILAFMLIPVWIPLIAMICGKTTELVKVRVERD